VTISLATSSNRPTTDVSGGGLFNVGPLLDLRAFLPGRQALGSVSFDVISDNGGRQNNCVVVGKSDRLADGLDRAKAVFRGDTKLQAIAFLHTCFVEEPQVSIRKIAKYVVEYENGRSVPIDLLENWNITDIRSSEGLRHNDWTYVRSPDVLIGAKPGWRGVSAAGIPLNLQLFIWRNPYPEQKIRTIRLDTTNAPPNTRIALLGLTFLQ
jgi:hypothetical protein